MPTAMGTPALDGKKNIYFFYFGKFFILNHLRGRGMPLARFSKDFFRFFVFREIGHLKKSCVIFNGSIIFFIKENPQSTLIGF